MSYRSSFQARVQTSEDEVTEEVPRHNCKVSGHKWVKVDKATYIGKKIDGCTPAEQCSVCKVIGFDSPHGLMARPYNGN
jgi:hypothetical protein